MLFRLAPIAYLIVLLLSAMAHSVNVIQTISNSTQKHVLSDTTVDRTRVLQHVPAQTVPFQPGQVGPSIQGFHVGACLQSVAPSGTISRKTPPPVVWDEQLGLSFTQDFTSLAYNVTAVEQSDVDGYGPAYLLNGLSSIGYWYQVGLSWNWPDSSGGYNSGFYLNYEVFNSSGSSIFPSSGGSGQESFSTTVNQGDTVLLALYFLSGNVIMYGYDFNTGAIAHVSYSAEGATDFTGTPAIHFLPSLSGATMDSNGFFTGLMTEWWHAFEYYGNEASVLYSDSTFALSSAWMWIDEWDPMNGTSLFYASTLNAVSYSNPTQLQYFSSNGATEASDAQDFITGRTANLVPITLSYSVVGGGTGYAPPELAYYSSGTLYVATLTTSPTTYLVDSGSEWSVSNPLSGSSSTETWSSNQQTSGVANSSQTISIAYYHQYLIVYSYSIEGGGNPAPPVLNGTSLGTSVNLVFGLASASVWLDSGTDYAFDSLLNASTTERWFTNQSPTYGTISSSNTFSPVYVHQFYVDVESDASAGGSISPNSSWVNAGQQIQISAAPSSGWQFESWSGSGTASYSGVLNVTTVAINSPVVEYATFYPGLAINVSNYGTLTYSYGLVSGSIPSSSSKVMYVPLNVNVSLTASPSFCIFQFEQWSGAVNSTSQRISMTVTTPIVLQANFGFNWLAIVITIAVIGGGLAAVIELILRRRGKQTQRA